ncbi:DMT family transporter [Sulfitobacter sp. S190]|uniref:DMT family transporter n=1 Tax=Sulfitobacter sp. S190 TaxID=2867022 RepID=UPI0021A5E176|nr:DMT family transporter [Sulfitobacter sp. S190]UWR22580.1 DMT family transporter [Sulfitobacter sp. S190]
MATISTQNRPGRAIGLRLMAIFLFMVMAALIKTASDTVPPGQAVFFRSLFAFPVILIWLWQQHDLSTGLIPRNLMGHVWRGVFGTSAMALTFGGLGLLPLPEVTAIGYATPLFTVLFAAFFLGERVRLFRLSAVGLGLIGVMIVLLPRLQTTDDPLSAAATIGALMVLAAAVLRALVQIHLRQLVKTEHTAAIVFYFSLTATCLSLLTLPLGMATGWSGLQWVNPGWTIAGLMITAGLIGGVAQILVTSSFRFGAASMLAPFDYASMIFASLIGWVVFGELPTSTIVIGAALVTAGGVLIIWRERQLGLDRNKSKANLPSHEAPS